MQYNMLPRKQNACRAQIMAAPSTFPPLLAAYNASIKVEEASKRDFLKSLSSKRQATLVGEQRKAIGPSEKGRPPRRGSSRGVASGLSTGRRKAPRRDPDPASSVKSRPSAVKLRLEEEAEQREKNVQVPQHTRACPQDGKRL